MEYKILESNSVEIENIDGAVFNKFAAGGKDGIIKGVLNECQIFSASSNSISISTGELILNGFRVKITDGYIYTFESLPASNTLYHLVARIDLYTNRQVSFKILCREVEPIIQTDMFDHSPEGGIHEFELAQFMVGITGISDLNIKAFPILNEMGMLEAQLKQKLSEIQTRLSSLQKEVNQVTAITYQQSISIDRLTGTDNELIEQDIISDREREAILNCLTGESPVIQVDNSSAMLQYIWNNASSLVPGTVFITNALDFIYLGLAFQSEIDKAQAENRYITQMDILFGYTFTEGLMYIFDHSKIQASKTKFNLPIRK